MSVRHVRGRCGGRCGGGADVPDDEMGRIKDYLARYYKKDGDTPPWKDD